MKVVLSPESLIDVRADMILLPVFSDERPLRGAAGWVDWHERGAISNLLKVGYLTGDFQERILYAPSLRFNTGKTLLVGLGDRREFTYFKAFKLFRHVVETLLKMRAHQLVLGVPDPATIEFQASRFVDRVIHGIVDGAWHDESFLENTIFTVCEKGANREDIYITLQRTRAELKERTSFSVVRLDQRPDYGIRAKESVAEALDEAV